MEILGFNTRNQFLPFSNGGNDAANEIRVAGRNSFARQSRIENVQRKSHASRLKGQLQETLFVVTYTQLTEHGEMFNNLSDGLDARRLLD